VSDNMEIHGSLRFQPLHPIHIAPIDKRMCLDIACYVVGHHKRIVLEIWDSSNLDGSSCWSLNGIFDKNLVKVDDKEQLSMHDLLQDMEL
jgi:hypothetical protein